MLSAAEVLSFFSLGPVYRFVAFAAALLWAATFLAMAGIVGFRAA